MLKRIAFSCIIALSCSPALAFAATEPANQTQLISLYGTLIQLLEQEVALIHDPSQTWLSIYPYSGVAPLSVTFIVNNPTGTESIDYGNGHTTGTNGCMKNNLGWCDLSAPVANTYPFPGVYTVKLYRHISPTQVVYLSTSTIDVVLPSAAQYDPNR